MTEQTTGTCSRKWACISSTPVKWAFGFVSGRTIESIVATAEPLPSGEWKFCLRGQPDFDPNLHTAQQTAEHFANRKES